MQEGDACRLIAINLYSFVVNPFTSTSHFNYELFNDVVYKSMKLSDDLIDLEVEHIDRIINKIKSDPEDEFTKEVEIRLWKKVRQTALNSRRTGLGITALGDTLAALGLKYDSEESLKVIETIMKLKMESEFLCSISMAQTRGTFNGWDASKEIKGNGFYKNFEANFPQLFNIMLKNGRRNLSVSTVAPTGSLSILCQTTSGIEPLFMPFYKRRKKINPSDTDVRIDFVDDTGDSWQEFFVLHPKFKLWMDINKLKYEDEIGLNALFEKSPWYKSTANDIDWIKRVEIQSIIQKYVTHSISSTINLPSDVSEKEVSDIYMESWKLGLKGITVYRDGSRSGVLVSNNTNNNTFKYIDAVKRPKELDAVAHTTTVSGDSYSIFVGLMNDKPYEVFCYKGHTKEGKGSIIKENKSNYSFIGTTDGSKHRILTGKMTDEQEAFTRLISGSLRHGRDIKFIVEDLNKTSGSMFSFNSAIARILKKYIPDGESSTVTCNECGSKNVVFEEGCQVCKDCGNSKCG